MVAKKKKKYSTGEAAQFMSRRQALNRLQLSLKDFRRLCILKGVYPREPRNRKRAQKGDTGIKTLYHKKDIQFLMHEPIIWKLRDYKIFNRKLGLAKARKDMMRIKNYLNNTPTLKLDHIVKERYPTFEDSLRDLDDCLTLCFLFSTFPSLAHIPRNQSALCRRLTVEFLHAVIESKSLRKVFISIKGYYYQAEIKGETVTWIVPHHFAFEPQKTWEVDFKVMSIFVEFYTVLLGFVNFKLYNMLNMFYPPKLGSMNVNDTEKELVDEEAFVSERIAALNIPLIKTTTETVEDVEIDTFDADGSPEEIAKAKEEAEKIKKLKTLFNGLKFFVNREVPREPLVFLIRSFGGEISWNEDLFVGATFPETDETITHQIVDRPSMERQYISRYYVQPQWVFDCVNMRELLPVDKYLIGKILPPHLSPFVDPERSDYEQYVPPEERELLNKEPVVEEEREPVPQKPKDESESEEEEEESKPKLSVTPGKVYKEPAWEKTKLEKQEYQLREKMIKNKHRKLYKSMMDGRRERAKAVWLLKKKRKQIDSKPKEGAKI